MDRRDYDAMQASGIAPCGCPRTEGPQEEGDTDTHSVLHGDGCTFVRPEPSVPVYPEDELTLLRERVAELESALAKKRSK